MEGENIHDVANSDQILMNKELDKSVSLGNHDEENDGDTATESYYDGEASEDENSSQYSYGDDNDGRPLPMPPLKYARIMGSLPRADNNSTAFAVKSTCSAMGRVVVRPSQYTEKGGDSQLPSGSWHGTSTNGGGRNHSDGATDWNEYDEDDEADMSQTKIQHVLALGFIDGKIRLVDVLTGGSVLFGSTDTDGGAWYVNTSASKRGHYDLGQRIVSLSFDSSSTYLSAVNANGDAAIFGPLVWGKQSQRTMSGGEGQQQQKLGFLSHLGGKEEGGTTKANNDERYRILRPAFTLVKPPASTVRFSYADPQSFGSSLLGGASSSAVQGNNPTCMVIDPAYAQRKEKAVIVGFDDGRLVLSKLQGIAGIGSGITSLFGGNNAAGGGGITVKKIDSVLYQGMGANSFSGDQAGIETVTWRGGLVAWADSSGVRLFDIEAMSRIAHIDRPTGARSSLYPTISSLHPSIMFERSDSLLIGWGDCLMALRVRESKSSTAPTKEGAPPRKVRKTVEASMAWELDCVACEVVPVDEKHVAVLGLVPSPSSSLSDVGESDQEAKSCNNETVAGGDNQLELQIINRQDGKSISNDILPLSEGPRQHHEGNIKHITTANATEFRLLSSFACPRMDGNAEWEVLDDAEKEALRKDGGKEGSQSAVDKELPDLHLMWNLDKDVCSSGNEIQSEAAIYDEISTQADDDQSVCSDNYVFALSEPIGDILDSVSTKTPPPIMAVVYSYDACLVQTRDVDDAISYTRSLGKPALALRQSLAKRREMRRHDLELLIDDLLVALLRMGSRKTGTRPLSFSRLKIATESLPILLGGDARMWQRWIFMFSKIPGGLFVIREKIPVRDPELPSFVFQMTLEKMLEETLFNCNGHDNNTNKDTPQQGEENIVGDKMIDLFLETMRSWGPTFALRRRIQLHRHTQNQHWGLQLSGSSAVAPLIQQAEKDLHRRISQTAFGILANAHHSSSPGQSSSIRQYIDSSKDSLFDVGHMIVRLSARLQPSDTDDRESLAINDMSSNVVIGTTTKNSAVIVESMAELELMRERLDRALGYYLAVGSHFMLESLPLLEETAVRSVNSFNQTNTSTLQVEEMNNNSKYFHILSMIELHQLSHILLKRTFFFSSEKDDATAQSPIVALIMLVGLSRAGRFLIENCSPPEGVTSTGAGDYDEIELSRSNLPFDLVAKQLESRPKLLYWFLFQVFIHKPEMYVRFPTTAVPPAAITKLHRLQFNLFLDYAVEERKNKRDTTSPAVLLVDDDTPFMSFLRATLPYGGVQADNVREKLEKYRGVSVDSSVFARELAFVIEKFGKDNVEDAKEVLQLYVRGAKNLYMAVSYAERNTEYSSILWDILVEHCTTFLDDDTNQSSAQGALFGSLLEAAAHTGSDLASLVARIPQGMSIEGLRPKLIAAISDYRYKVKIHEHVDNILMEDKVSILRELSHLSRRGVRMNSDGKQKDTKGLALNSSDLLKSQRIQEALSHRETHSFSLPIR